MLVPIVCLLGACFLGKRDARRARSRSHMRNVRFSHTNDRGELVFVPTQRGLDLIAQGRLDDVTCPTGETCKHACACSGVSASGIVGVGATCRCITLEQPPNPSVPPRPMGFAQRRR